MAPILGGRHVTRRMKYGTVLWLAILVTAVPVRADDDDRDDVEEMKKALAASKVTLAEAIRIAAREVAAGQPLEVDIEWKHGVPRIEVELVVGEVWKDVYIHGVTGRVMRTEENRADDADDRAELRRDKEALAAAKRSFTEAIDEAMKKEPDGRVVKIELKWRDGRPEYKVKLLSGERLVTVRIDAGQT